MDAWFSARPAPRTPAEERARTRRRRLLTPAELDQLGQLLGLVLPVAENAAPDSDISQENEPQMTVDE